MNDFDFDNEIIDVTQDFSKNSSLEDIMNETTDSEEVIINKKRKRRSFKEWFRDLSKKKKVFFILSIVLVLLIIIGVVLYFVVFKSDKEDIKEESIVLEADNYRYDNGKLVFLDGKKEIGTYNCKKKDAKKCMVYKNDLSEDEFDRPIDVYENDKEIIKNTPIYFDQFVFVQDDDKVYLYDIDKKETVLELDKVKVYDTEEEYVVTVIDDSYGLIKITKDGYEEEIKNLYTYLGIVNPGKVLMVAKDKTDSFIIDEEGKVLSKNVNVTIKSVDNNFIVGYSNGSYRLYNYEFEELLSDNDFIGLDSGIICSVVAKNLYLYDAKLNKLNVDGIKLTSNDYVKKSIYNKKNKLVETKLAYEINVNSNSVYVTVGKENYEINMLDSSINSTLGYMNYINGKLYFYSDVEKNDLIGFYECTNKNNINSVSDGLNNCHIYNNDKGFSGIYNNQFVFIYDNLSNTNNIYLVDLKGKTKKDSIKGTYSDVQIVKSEEISNDIKPVYTSSSLIVVKAASGGSKDNYGVIEITSSKVQGKKEFAYSKIEYNEKGFYVFTGLNKKISLYNKSFENITDEFDQIDFYDNYYVGIKNDKLNIYSYSKTGRILKEDLTLKDNKYSLEIGDTFKFTIDGKLYEYDLTGEAKKEDTKPKEPTKPEKPAPDTDDDSNDNDEVDDGE